MTGKTGNKTGLVLTPQLLLKNEPILELLHISKTATGIKYKTEEPDSRAINQSFPHLPKELKEILFHFSAGYCEKREKAIKEKFKTGRAGMAFSEFFETALLRDWHGLLKSIKPFAPLLKLYKKTWVDTRSLKIAPLSLSAYQPQLVFEVIKEKDDYLLQTNIGVNGTAYKLSDFKQFHFLLADGNEYFLLAYKDFQTLKWLTKSNPEQYKKQPLELVQNIIARLEETYPVNRNNLFARNVIDPHPINRVLLSEISNSFLVFTPQWDYEGFLMEGPWKEETEITAAGEVYVVKRNKEAERQFSKLLEGLHPNFANQLNGYYYLTFAEAQKKQWFLKVYHSLLQQDIQMLGMDMLQHFRYSPHKAVTEINIFEDKNNLLTVKLSLNFGEEEVPLGELQKMLWAGQKTILLKDGSLGILGDDWMQQYGTMMKHGKVSKNEISIARWMALTEDKTQEENSVLKPVIRKDWWQRWQQWQEPDTIIYKLPAGIAATLRPYQQKGFEWMVLLAEAGAGACLADDMGLGKTLQTICALAYQLEKNPGGKHLIICPSSLLYNWDQELKKFAPGISVLLYHGVSRDFEQLARGTQQVVITTYGTTRSDIEKLVSIHFGVAVIDESHNIKNPSALITRAVGQLRATNRIALSGTPVMNNTFDLYAQLGFLLPGMFGSREFFKREYADAIDREQAPDKIKALQKLTAPFILRRTKEQVATDLPEKTETILWCEMGIDQKLAYETIRENVRSSVFLDIREKGLGSGKLSVINGLLKLRQLCNSAELVKDEEIFCYDSIKTEILMDELENILPLHKALVFSQFTRMIDLLEIRLQKQHIPYFRLDGSTPVSKRQELVNNFQDDHSSEKVFLISLKAGNAGLNLTAADYVFLFDPWWNTAVQQQAIDRTHRIGQTKNVFAYKMICKGTIEEKIMQLQQRKSKLAAELIGEEEGFVKALTETDIEFLFS